MREKSYDVVIVGSGAGGGTVAKELAPLAAAGKKIAVLEWGPKLAESEYTGREMEMAKKLYVDSGGFITARADDDARVRARVRRLDGRLHRHLADHPARHRRALEGARARLGRPCPPLARLHGGEQRPPARATSSSTTTTACSSTAARSWGYRVEQFPINVKGCKGSSLCNLGCPNAAKQGTHRVQLPRAEAAGVEVITNCKVERLGERDCTVTVANPGFGLPSAWEPGEYRVRAKAFVIAAGAVGSPALLLRSRLPVRLPALGRYFTAHPALILVGEHAAADHQLLRPPQELLLRPLRRVRRLPARDLHVLPVRDREEPRRVRRRSTPS